MRERDTANVLRSSVVVTAQQLQQMSESTSVVFAPAACICCDVAPATGNGVLCDSCRAATKKESE